MICFFKVSARSKYSLILDLINAFDFSLRSSVKTSAQHPGDTYAQLTFESQHEIIQGILVVLVGLCIVVLCVKLDGLLHNIYCSL